MKIIDKRKQDSIAFANVPMGGTFTFLYTDERGDGPYIRINDVVDEYGLLLNAVDLEDGYAVNVEDNIPVILCDAEVVIN